MLDIDNPVQLTPPNWDDLVLQARLPIEAHEYLSKRGPMQVMPDSRRRYRRLYLRTKAVVYYRSQFYGAYMADVSRSGVGFFSPVQLLPAESIALWLPGGRVLQLKTTGCVRHANNCYRCGAEYAARLQMATNADDRADG